MLSFLKKYGCVAVHVRRLGNFQFSAGDKSVRTGFCLLVISIFRVSHMSNHILLLTLLFLAHSCHWLSSLNDRSYFFFCLLLFVIFRVVQLMFCAANHTDISLSSGLFNFKQRREDVVVQIYFCLPYFALWPFYSCMFLLP